MRTSPTLHTGLTLFLLLCLILSLSGCSTRVPLAIEDPSQWTTRSKISIVLDNGREYIVREPRLADSKLQGIFSPDDRQEAELAEITSLSVRELDTARTVGLALWGLAATIVLITLLGDGGGEEPCPT